MPTFRIVYIEDDSFSPRTLTAAFRDRASAEIAMAKHGHRVVHIASLGAGEAASDPVVVPMAPERKAGEARAERPRPAPATATRPWLGLPRYDLAGAVAVVVGIAAAGAVIWLF